MSTGTKTIPACEFARLETRQSRKERLLVTLLAFILLASVLLLAWTFAGIPGVTYATIIDLAILAFTIHHFNEGRKKQNAGFRGTPVPPWTVESNENQLTIQTRRYRVEIPNEAIHSATLLIDVSDNQLPGMEARVLTIALQTGVKLTIPGSTEGFEEASASLMNSGVPFAEVAHSGQL